MVSFTKIVISFLLKLAQPIFLRTCKGKVAFELSGLNNLYRDSHIHRLASYLSGLHSFKFASQGRGKCRLKFGFAGLEASLAESMHK